MRAPWIAVLAAGTSIGLAVAVGAGRQQPARTQPCWEYGRIYITGGTAVLESQTSICRVELPLAPPENLTVYRSTRGQFERKWNPQLYAVNVFGGDGWEIEPGAELRENQPYLVRRLR